MKTMLKMLKIYYKKKEKSIYLFLCLSCKSKNDFENVEKIITI